MAKKLLVVFGLAYCAVTANAAPVWVDAIVVKAEGRHDRLALKQPAIDAWDMPPLTMNYKVKDAAWLKLVPGQKVHAQVDRVDSCYTVISLEAGPPPAVPE